MKKVLIILLLNLFISPVVSNKTNVDIHLCIDMHHLTCDSFCECDGLNCNLSLTKF
jgi:hypothetical protein